MGFIEGIRAGQDLAAMLGYQFERGLHENYPGVELDEYIYVLRARFPLVSRRLTPVPDGAAAEVIEARNVIDGYDLIDYVRTRTYPFDIDGLPTEQAKANAIQAEIVRLEEMLDAISDLMMAESVHQAVQSNIDRARGAVGAIVDGEMPPVPDVVQTPRSGRLLTQRVALNLPAAGAGWMSSPTPRAQANPRLNAWLAAQLPSPNTIGIEVRMASTAAQTATLDQMGLDVLDVVLMSGDRFGNGSSELERWLADRARSAMNVEDDVLTVFGGPTPGAGAKTIVVDASTASGATPVATLLPHLRALRRLIGATRGVHAQDYRLASDRDKADPKNPKGFKLDAIGDLDVLPTRANSAYNDLNAAATTLKIELDTLQLLYDALRTNPASFNGADWTTGLASLRTKLRTLALFGAPEALPRSAAGVNVGAALGLFEQGRAVLEGLTKRLSRAANGRLDRRLDNLIDATRQALGQNFPLQPLFQLDPAARVEIESRLADPIEKDALVLEAWLQLLARVRPRMADLALASAASLWTTGREPRLAPVQIPLRAGDPWIGAAWTSAPAAGEVMSVMTIDAPAALNGDLEGLLIDDWTETVPTTKETTGIAFHFDRPNAAAPQALLLATPPNPDGRWRWEELLGVIVDTFARARLRAIEPDLIAASPLFPILPMTMMSFTSARALTSTFLASDAANFVKFRSESSMPFDIKATELLMAGTPFLPKPFIKGWNRLEGRVRTEEFERALRAEARDPLWFLTRQWQFLELKGDDAGSPIEARVALRQTKLARFATRDGPARPFPTEQPLEAMVERESLPMDRIALIQIHRAFDKALAGAGLSPADRTAVHDGMRAAYSLDPTKIDGVDDEEAHQLAGLADARLFDGAKLLADANVATTIDSQSGLAATLAAAAKTAATTVKAWYAALYLTPTAAEESAWAPSQLEYQFSCATEPGQGQTVLIGNSYAQGRLDWFAVDVAVPDTRLGETNATPSPPLEETLSFLPTAISFAGMPSNRFWEMENRKVEFGAITAHTTDIAKILLIEFMLAYANDWCLIPLEVDVGSLCDTMGLIVHDVFGDVTLVRAADHGTDEELASLGDVWT